MRSLVGKTLLRESPDLACGLNYLQASEVNSAAVEKITPPDKFVHLIQEASRNA